MANKKVNLTNVTIIPASVSAEAGRFLAKQELQSLPFWNELKERDQETLTSEVRQLTAARMMHITSGLAIGKHLLNIYNACEAYSGTFRKVATTFGFAERSAYRYMESYKNAGVAFPEQILKAAIVRGLDVLSYNKEKPLGKYTEVVRLLPPPQNADYAEANRYVDQLEQTYKERRKALASGEIEPEESEAEAVKRDPQFLLRQNFRGIKNALLHVPKARRRRWFESLVGMGMTQMGISSAVSFEPEAIPEDFRQGPGRPPSVHEAA